MANSEINSDPRFTDNEVGKLNVPAANGVVKIEDKGDGFVALTDRDGRVYIEELRSEDDAAAVRAQKAADLAIEYSPVVNEAAPGHSEFDGRPAIEMPANDDNAKVVNEDLGVDKNDESK